jgi:hypothetical protein
LREAAKAEGAHLPLFLAPPVLKPFISEDLYDGPLKPILYQSGKRVMIGYDAELLPAVCDVWLRARQAGALQAQQLDKAQRGIRSSEIVLQLRHIGARQSGQGAKLPLPPGRLDSCDLGRRCCALTSRYTMLQALGEWTKASRARPATRAVQRSKRSRRKT